MKNVTSNSTYNVFGNNDIFIGEFILLGPLRVDGILKGKVITNNRLHISHTGHGIGLVSATIVDIGGLFEGDLIASERVIIRSTGCVKGRIRASIIEVEEGGSYSGQCKINKVKMRHVLADFPHERVLDSFNQELKNLGFASKDMLLHQEES